MAIIACTRQGMASPNSVLVAVDPETLKVLDSLDLPEPAPSPHIIAPRDGKAAIYIGMEKTLGRWFWDPETRKLTIDES